MKERLKDRSRKERSKHYRGCIPSPVHSESGQAERGSTTMDKEKKIHYKEIDNQLEKIKIEVLRRLYVQS